MFILNIYTFRCLALPWLIFSMLEILILGCPAVIFFSLLGIYLYIQVNFYTQHLPVYPGTLLIYTWHLPVYSGSLLIYAWHLPVYPGTLLIYTWHLPVYSGTPLCSASTCLSRYTSYLYLASTCLFRYTFMLGIYLYIQVHIYTWHLTCIIRYYLDIQVHHCTRLLPMYPGTLIYSELPVFPGTHVCLASTPVYSSKLK